MTILAVATVLATVGPVTSADAQTTTVRRSASERVLGEVTSELLTVTLPNGDVARGNLVRFPEATGTGELRPHLAQGTVAGLQRFDQMATQQYRAGAIAGVNGGYFLPRPWGAPNGLHVEAGQLSAGQTVGSRGQIMRGRAALGIRPEGRVVVDRLEVRLLLDTPSASAPATFTDLNRATGTATANSAGELLLFDDRYGTDITVPVGAVLVLTDGLRVGSSGRTEGRVTQVRPSTDSSTTIRVARGTHALVATGNRVGDLGGIVPGDRLGVTTTIDPLAGTPVSDWASLRGGLAGGQHLIHDGAIVCPSGVCDIWEKDASFDAAHSRSRRARTAVGRTAGGETLLVTIDGDSVNQGRSVGMSVIELAATMYRLGAVQAVNLDGGGSTSMALRGQVVNRVSDPHRTHATGLFVYAQLPPPSRSPDRACPPGRVPRYGFADVPGTTHESAIDCLAWWGVTAGKTATHYVPRGNVTRAQMATFLTKWIDDAAARGSGRALPRTTDNPFRDVSDTNTHVASIARLSEAGIIAGTSATTFAPDSSITRAQTATLVRKATDHVTGQALPSARDYFVDDNGSAHEQSINRLARAGVTGGVGGFDFDPGSPVSRGAMASLVMRASDLLVEQGIVTPPN